MDEEKVDVVIVGAGLAGLAAACLLADAGLEVLVIERGDQPGSKNVTGGRLYMNPVRPYFPAGFWDDAPFERPVVKERLIMTGDGASTSVELFSQRFTEPPHHSYTVLRARFDAWLGEVAGEKGAMIIPRQWVGDLVIRDGKVQGIVADEEEILAEVVVAADGTLSFLAEKAGLRPRYQPKDFAVGMKQIVELPAKTIEDRFALDGDQGAAQLFFGSITQGMMGGGFLYTNQESLSIGLVLGIEALAQREPKLEAHEVMEQFMQRPEIQALTHDGETVEYSAHVIPEGGVAAVPQLVTDGMVVVGDAAGLALNMLVTVRGMDFALASGAMAAQAIIRARDAGDFSATGLAYYETLLKDSFVWKDMQAFAQVPHVLENPRLFALYPQAGCDIFEKVMWIGDGPKDRLFDTAWREARSKLVNLTTVRDALGWRRI